MWIPHLAELSRYEGLAPYNGEIRDRFTVMYLGSFVSFMDMGNILRAAKVLQDRGLTRCGLFWWAAAPTAKRWKSWPASWQLRNLRFPGLVAKKDIAGVMSDADAFVVSLRDVPLLKYGISLNKACDYLASGRPTVFAGSPGYDPIKEAQAGISVSAANPEALADAVEALMALSPERRVQMGRNGREYLRRVHDVKVLADRLEKILTGDTRHKPSEPAEVAAGYKSPVPLT